MKLVLVVNHQHQCNYYYSIWIKLYHTVICYLTERLQFVVDTSITFLRVSLFCIDTRRSLTLCTRFIGGVMDELLVTVPLLSKREMTSYWWTSVVQLSPAQEDFIQSLSSFSGTGF